MASDATTIGSNDAISEQDVRARAYEIFLQRGAQPGFELEDWLQAELELTTQLNRRDTE